MITIDINEAKTHLSHYLDEVEKGERVVVCKRNRPVAEIRPIAPPPTEKRPIGLARGTFTVPDSFFDELPDETIALYSSAFRSTTRTPLTESSSARPLPEA